MRDEATAIFRAAVEAVQPNLLVEAVLRAGSGEAFIEIPNRPRVLLPRPVTVVGAGKAAAAMARGCEHVLGRESVTGEVIATDGAAAKAGSIRVHHARHPLPDERGVAATRSLLRRLRDVSTGPVLCLISGGASSLLVCPREPLTLADKIETNRLLLESGAPIAEVNTVRKHLSEVKGGGMLRHTRAHVATLLISDVVGDDPGTIGSGPTAPDPTTFDDAARIVADYGLADRIPSAVRALLDAGIRGEVPETIKTGSSEAKRSTLAVIGSNRMAIAGAAKAAAARGWNVNVVDEPIVGDTTAAARAFARRVHDLAAQQPGRRVCVIAGGETTVHVRGPGRGGRNQEFALALADELAGSPICVLSAGTDGIDGPTDAAGAFVDGETSERARRRGLDPAATLAANDSYTFFDTLGDSFRCGATGTNVMDIKIALAGVAA